MPIAGLIPNTRLRASGADHVASDTKALGHDLPPTLLVRPDEVMRCSLLRFRGLVRECELTEINIVCLFRCVDAVTLVLRRF
jgi:hypothetical protein